MASDAVNKIISAEQLADKLNAEARNRAEEIVSSAHQRAGVAVQKKLAEAKAETEKKRKADGEKLREYAEEAEKKCAADIEKIRLIAEENSEDAVNAVIDGFFS